MPDNLHLNSVAKATFDARLKFSRELDKCSEQNGYWDASISYGMEMRDRKKYLEAL